MTPRPHLERLERRDTPTDFSASTYAELSADVTTANGNGVDDTITVTATIDFPANSPLTLGETGHALAILGGAGMGTLDGHDASRLLQVTAGTVSLADLTLTRGRAAASQLGVGHGGAASVTGGLLDATRVVFTGNAAVADSANPQAADAEGGAVYVGSSGTLSATACGFDANSAAGHSLAGTPASAGTAGGTGQAGDQGGFGFGGGSGRGGAIAGVGSVTVTGSVFRNNTATGGDGQAGGAGGRGGRGIEAATVTPAGAGGRGGDGGQGGAGQGGAVYAAGPLSVFSTTFGAGNTAAAGAGGRGGAGGDAGGGPSRPGGTPAGAGGAGGPGGAAGGGALFAVGSFGAILGNSTVTGNSAAAGVAAAGGVGGLDIFGQPAASGPNGAAGVRGAGGVEVGPNGGLTVASTTVASNTAVGVAVGSAATLTVFNGLFADNPGGDLTGTGSVTASGSLIEASTVTVTPGAVANVVGVDPGLAPAAANGSPPVVGDFVRLTHALPAGSPARDIGDATKLTADLLGPNFAFDGRGNFARTVGDATDAGSFEGTAAAAPPSLTVTVNQAPAQPDPTATASVAFVVTFSHPVPSFPPGDISLAGSTATGTLAVAVSPATGAATVFTVTVTGMTGAGVVVASFPGNQVESADNPGVMNGPSTSTDNRVTYTPPPPVPTAVGFDVTLSGAAPVVGQPFTVTVRPRLADGSTATNFVGRVTVTLTSDAGVADLTVTITFAPGDGVKSIVLTPPVPGTVHVRAAAADTPTVTGVADLSVAPVAPGTADLFAAPVLQETTGYPVALTAGRYATADGRVGDEPAVLSVRTLSVLDVNPVHLSTYGLLNAEVGAGTGYTAIEAANLSSYGFTRSQIPVDPSLPNDFALSSPTGLVSVVFDGNYVEVTSCGDFQAFGPVGNNFDVGGSPQAVTAARLNPAGPKGVVVANYAGVLNLLLNAGDTRPNTGQGGNGEQPDAPPPLVNDARHFSFTHDADVQVGGLPTAVVAAPFTATSDPTTLVDDLAVVDSATNRVLILKNRFNEQFDFLTPLTLPNRLVPHKLAAGDLDGDGKQDLAVAATDAEGKGFVAIYYGDGFGGFTPAQVFEAVNGATAVTIADVNHDGQPDLLVAGVGEGNLGVLLHDGADRRRSFVGVRRFGIGQSFGFFGIFPPGLSHVVSRDFNNDGTPDVAVLGTNGYVFVLAGI